MKIMLGVVFVLGVLGLEQVAALKSYGRYYVKQESIETIIKDNEICKSSFWLERKPRKDRIGGFERLVAGYIDCSRKINPVGGTIIILKQTEAGWKNDYKPIEMKTVCDRPFDYLFDPYFAHFSGELNKKDCSINQGNHTLKGWTIEDNIRLAIGEKFFYGRYKYIMTLEIPGRKDPIAGTSLIFTVDDADLLEYTLKGKRNGKHH